MSDSIESMRQRVESRRVNANTQAQWDKECAEREKVNSVVGVKLQALVQFMKDQRIDPYFRFSYRAQKNPLLPEVLNPEKGLVTYYKSGWLVEDTTRMVKTEQTHGRQTVTDQWDRSQVGSEGGYTVSGTGRSTGSGLLLTEDGELLEWSTSTPGPGTALIYQYTPSDFTRTQSEALGHTVYKNGINMATKFMSRVAVGPFDGDFSDRVEERVIEWADFASSPDRIHF